MKKTVFYSLLGFTLYSLTATASTWQVVTPESSISFIATYDEIAFEGQFEQFNAHIDFDQNDIASAKISCEIDIISVNTNSRDRDDALRDKAWFYPSKFPAATFTSHSVQHQNDNTFLLHGTLQIRNVEQEVMFPFTWQQENNTATTNAEFELDRRDYNIGTGDWAEDKTIGFSVIVKLSLLLKKI